MGKPSDPAAMTSTWRRLVANVICDFKLAQRNGFFLAALVISAIHLALLWWMRSILDDWILALVLLEIFIFNGFYFAAALVLLSKSENTLGAQFLTPLQPTEWVLAKCLVLSLLAIIEGLFVTLPLWQPALITLLLSAVLMTSFLCQLGLAMVQRYRSLSEFLMPSSLVFLLLLIPVLQLTEVWSSQWLALHPMTPYIMLLKSSLTTDASATHLWWWAAAIFWLIPGQWLATGAVNNMALDP